MKYFNINLVFILGSLQLANGQTAFMEVNDFLLQLDRALINSLNNFGYNLRVKSRSFINKLDDGVIQIWMQLYQIPVKFNELDNNSIITDYVAGLRGNAKSVRDHIQEIVRSEGNKVTTAINSTVHQWQETIYSTLDQIFSVVSSKIPNCRNLYGLKFRSTIERAYSSLSTCLNKLSSYAKFTDEISPNFRNFVINTSNSLEVCPTKSNATMALACITEAMESYVTYDVGSIFDNLNQKISDFNLDKIVTCVNDASDKQGLELKILEGLIGACMK